MPSKKFVSPPSHVDQNIHRLDPSDMKPRTSKNVDLSRTTIYQVDYTCVNAGKTVSATKRRIRWRFGFASAAAIDAGEMGPQCRGEEHEIILNWSLTSGKRIVLVDGNEVFAEIKPYETTLEYAWEMKGGHVVKIRGSVAPKMWKDTTEKQFEMWLNGKKFSDFSQIFELGRVSTRSAPRKTVNATTTTRRSRNRKMPESEQVDWPQETFYSNNTPTTAGSEQSSFDFASREGAVNTSVSQIHAAPAPTFDEILEMNYTEPVEPTPNFFDTPLQPAPVAQAPNTFDYDAQYKHNLLSQQVMQAYQNAPNVISPGNIDPALEDTKEEESIVQHPQEALVPVFGGEETYIAPRTKYDEEEQDSDDVASLLKKLCNLEDISSAPNPTGKLSIINASESKKKKEQPNKSTPIAPTIIQSTGPQPSLNDIKTIHGTSSPPTSSQEVMKAPPAFVVPQGATAGALVVHGSQTNQWNAHAAPPLHRPTGFGIGAQMGQGYGDYTSTHQSHGTHPQSVYANM